MKILFYDMYLTIADEDLPSNGKVLQTTEAVTKRDSAEGDLVHFDVICTSGSLEPGRTYSVIAVQNGSNLIKVSYQPIN